LASHGHTKADARRIRDLVEQHREIRRPGGTLNIVRRAGFHDVLNGVGDSQSSSLRDYFTSVLQNFSIRSKPFSMFAMLVA